MKLRDATIRVVDFETTGVDPETEKVCEAGAVDISYCAINGCWMPTGMTLNYLVDPKIPMPAVASAVHHLVDGDLIGEPTEEEVLPMIFLGHPLYAAHNAEFDRAFAGKYGENAPWLCTMRLAKHLLPDAPSYKNQVLRYLLGFNNVPGDPHRAEHDAHVTALILCSMLNDLVDDESHTVESIVEMAESPVLLTGTIGFGKHSKLTWRECPRNYLQWMAKQGKQGPGNPDGWDRDQWHTVNEILSGNYPREGV